MEFLRNIEEAAFSILSQLGAPPPRRIQQGSLRSILAQLQSMKTYVDDTINTRLDFYIEVGHTIAMILYLLEDLLCINHEKIFFPEDSSRSRRSSTGR